jgi:hypothetical protein
MLKETLVGGLSWYLPGGIEESHVKPQDSRPSGLDLNLLSPKTKQGIHHTTRLSVTLESKSKVSGSQDSSVGTATGYVMDIRGVGVRFLAGTGDFYLIHTVQTSSAAIQCVPWVKPTGREADH